MVKPGMKLKLKCSVQCHLWSCGAVALYTACHQCRSALAPRLATFPSMSDRSHSSHSLHLKGPVIESESNTTKTKPHKKAAHWTDKDTTTLLEFLIKELPKASNGNFKRSTWTAVASLFSTQSGITKWGVKDADSCECRFQLVS